MIFADSGFYVLFLRFNLKEFRFQLDFSALRLGGRSSGGFKFRFHRLRTFPNAAQVTFRIFEAVFNG